jgi:hypothetical protein
MLPDRIDGTEATPDRAEVPSESRHARRAPWWRTLFSPSFALAAAASLAVVFVAGAVVSQFVGGSRLVAVAPIGRAVSPDLELAWQPVAAATAYDVTMSWPSGKVFFESGPTTSTRLAVPAAAVAQMKRGQTCLWTLRALDAQGVEIARETFSFVVDFDPPRE